MASYEDVVQKDLTLMWSILEYCEETPWIHTRMTQIISKYPWKDIVVIIWLFFIIGLFEVGTKHFFVVMMNLCFAFVLRALLEVKRPVEYDIRLQPLTDINAESYGFPSLESYMSVIIFGHIAIHLQSVLFVILGCLITALVGFSRVYSRSRFPHQIVGSWLVALAGLVGSMHCCEKMNFHNMTHHEHGVCVGFVVLSIGFVFGLNMENNDSRLLHIPKSEFVRVMSEIINGGTQQSNDRTTERTRGDDGEGDEDDRNDGRRDFEPSPRNKRGNTAKIYEVSSNATGLGESPRTAATKQAQQSTTSNELNNRKKRYVKSDSLYFLQKGMEERESHWKQEKQTKAELLKSLENKNSYLFEYQEDVAESGGYRARKL